VGDVIKEQESSIHHPTVTSSRNYCTVAILNHNGKNLLAECLDSIAAQTFTSFETVVIDNGSTDGSKDFLAAVYPWVKVLALAENKGFSAAYNVCMRDALERGVEFFLLLNNDTWVGNDFLEELLKVAQGDNRIGAVCPKIYFASDLNKMWYAGGDFNLWLCRPRHRGFREIDRGQFDGTNEVTLATGCAMLVRCSALRTVGLLDEQLWAYLEDVEWSVRFLKSDYKLAFAPKAHVWHYWGETNVKKLGGGSEVITQYLNTRNALLLARKHLHWWQTPTHLLSFLVNHVLFFTALRLWRRDFRALLSIYRGIGRGFWLSFKTERWKTPNRR